MNEQIVVNSKLEDSLCKIVYLELTAFIKILKNIKYIWLYKIKTSLDKMIITKLKR